MRAVLTGVFNESPSLAPIEIDERCPYCGTAVELQYRDEQLTARCTGCGGVVRADEFPSGTYLRYGFPPSGLAGRSPEAVLEAAHVLYDSKIAPTMAGVCPECAGRVDHSLDVCGDLELAEDGLCYACDTRFSVWTEYACSRCRYRRTTPWFELLTDPAVIACYNEHTDFGQTVPFSTHTWENVPYIRCISQSVRSGEPLRVTIVVELEPAEREVVLDENLAVVEVDRTERE